MDGNESIVKPHHFVSPIIAGGVAGSLVVSITYPLDTLKTRLQTAQGFKAAGGFRGLYKGFLTLSTGAFFINSLFFGTYDAVKRQFEDLVEPKNVSIIHSTSASACRSLTCLIRVPVEIAKQRQQTMFECEKLSAFSILWNAYKREGICHGLYRGFLSTVLRDVPFSLIEIPLWELFKNMVKARNYGQITNAESAFCGSIAAGWACLITSPFDVAKTRIILEDEILGDVKRKPSGVMSVLRGIYAETGIKGWFAGVTPRMMMTMVGGFIFFGLYEIIIENIDARLAPWS